MPFPNLRELLKAGYFDAEPSFNYTQSGRAINKPSVFGKESFTKGSGCCVRGGLDETEMGKK